MKKNPHALHGSGGKHTLGEMESQMPSQNMRGNLNVMNKGTSMGKKDTERGYTDGTYYGPKGKDNAKIKY